MANTTSGTTTFEKGFSISDIVEEAYERLALELATNPEKLSSIKQKLAINRLSKPLFNTELYTKHLEDGYQRAYQRYFEGKKAATIYVPE